MVLGVDISRCENAGKRTVMYAKMTGIYYLKLRKLIIRILEHGKKVTQEEIGELH